MCFSSSLSNIQNLWQKRRRKIKHFLLTWWTENLCIIIALCATILVGLSLSWNLLWVKWSLLWILAANIGWDIKAVAWVLFIGVLVNVSYCWSPAAQPARLLQQLKFLMAITQHAQSCSTCWSMGHISLCCTDSGAAACISGKGKALSWAECRGAWHDINENMAVTSCSH